MKEIKKTVLALMAAVTVLFASAALPALADENYTSDAGYTEDAGDTVPEPIAAQDTQQTQQAEPVSAPASNDTKTRSGVSFGTVFLMFILGILINAGLSFVIGDRFYKLSKKDSHLQGEIRALRRDINEKFTGGITEIKEKAATVTNSNKNYSRGSGISYREPQPQEDFTEVSKRWDINVEEAADPEVTIRTTRRTGARGAQPRRRVNADTRRAPRTRDNDGLDADEGVSDSVKDKAKKFLGDIFPFEDE